MKLTVTKGAPLPFSIDILLPQEMYGSKPFIKYPDNIPDYIKFCHFLRESHGKEP